MTKSLPADVRNGKLKLQFTAGGGSAVVSTISVIPDVQPSRREASAFTTSMQIEKYNQFFNMRSSF